MGRAGAAHRRTPPTPLPDAAAQRLLEPWSAPMLAALGEALAQDPPVVSVLGPRGSGRRTLLALWASRGHRHPERVLSFEEDAPARAAARQLRFGARPLGVEGERLLFVPPLPAPLALALWLHLARLRAPSAAPPSPTELRRALHLVEHRPLGVGLAVHAASTVGLPALLEAPAALLEAPLPGGSPPLREAVEARLRALAPPLRDALAQLSAFASSFTAEDARALLGDASAHLSLARLHALAREGLLWPEAETPRLRVDWLASLLLREAPPSPQSAAAHATYCAREARALEDRGGAPQEELPRMRRLEAESEALARRWRPDAPAAERASEPTLRALLGAWPLQRLHGASAWHARAVQRVLSAPELPPALALEARLYLHWAARRLPSLEAPALDFDAAFHAHRASAPRVAARCALTAATRAHAAQDPRALHRWLRRFDALAPPLGAPDLETERDALLADHHWRERRPDLAVEAMERAVERCLRHGLWSHEAHALASLGEFYLDQRREEEAARCLARAAQLFERTGATARLGYLALVEGMTQLQRGDASAARAAFERAQASLAAVSDARLLATARGGLGLVHLALGEGEAALELLQPCAQHLHACGERHHGWYFESFLVVALAQAGAAGRARALEQRLSEEPSLALDALLASVLRVQGLHRALLEAHGERERDPVQYRASRVLARAELARLDAPEHAAPNDLRVAIALARRVLGGPSASGSSPGPLLRAAPDASRFTLDDGPAVDLARRPLLARLLRRLLDERLAAPGRAVSAEDLVAAGWPGQRVSSLAARNRLKVAVAALRSAGLGAHLASRDGGYLLSDALRVLEEVPPS